MEEEEFFRLFTPQSLVHIEDRIAEEKAFKKAEKQAHEEGEEEELAAHEEEEPKPNPKYEAGKKLPLSLKDLFPVEYTSKPLEDFDEFYETQKTFVVVGKDMTIYRFSATNALYLLSPFNPIRRGALYVLVHPLFSALIIITIIVNCAFMAMTEQPFTWIEYVFTGVYTMEALIKISARGFIINTFTYLRDPWNWLDFAVISLAYVTMGVDLGNLSALRTFRVLRALKTVAVIPGLKTIVGALLEAVRRLRDVMILTVFMLSIFALVGMQLYMGTLRQKCVTFANFTYDNSTEGNETAWSYDDAWIEYAMNPAHWYTPDGTEYLICGNASGAGHCPPNYVCINNTHTNPNFNFTHFDNFGTALLCTFRLMTQDFWENLYQITLRAEGPYHCAYFIIVILLGSFYLVNLILAIVAMSYDETQKQDQADADEEEEERKKAMQIHAIQQTIHDGLREDYQEYLEEKLSQAKSHSETSLSDHEGEDNADKISVRSNKPEENGQFLSVSKKQPSLSLPGSPFVRRNTKKKYNANHGDHQPLMLDNLPYIDDPNAVTPCSDDLNMNLTYKQFLASRRNSYASLLKRTGSSRRSSFASRDSRRSLPRSPRSPLEKPGKLDTPWDWKKPKDSSHLHPLDAGEHGKHVENGSLHDSRMDIEKKSHDGDMCHPHAGKHVDPRDMMVIKNLLAHAEGHRNSKHSIISEFPFEEEELPLKDRLYNRFCSWHCCRCYVKFQEFIAMIILDAFVDLFITICILANTAFMAADQHPKSPELAEILIYGNYVFTGIFASEAFLKLIALSPPNYFRDGWNIFDFFIVVLSFLEMALDGVSGLSVLRSFRLLRVFKLARSWQTLNMLIRIVAGTMGALGNLIFVLAIVVFIFAVMGQQLFRDGYLSEYADNMPRWNFTDFLHSFMIIFRVLCGEWIESMWACTNANGPVCVPFFLLTYVIGNLVVLNLFLALLLNSFGAESLSGGENEEDKEPNKLSEAIGRFTRLGRWIKVKVIVCLKVKMKSKPKPNGGDASPRLNGKDLPDGGQPFSNGTVIELQAKPEDTEITLPGELVLVENHSPEKSTGILENEKKMDDETRPNSRGSQRESLSSNSRNSMSDDDTKLSLTKVDAEGEPEINEVKVTYANYPDDCFCKICRRKCPCCIRFENTKLGKRFWKIRCLAYALVEHKYFETFIITMILASSVALAIEDVYLSERPILAMILEITDRFFTAIFILEMLIKWTAFGFKKYFTDAWCWLDFVIVGISIMMLVFELLGLQKMTAIKAMRTLRALRPLRAVSRWEGMRVVVNALIKAIPSIANVMMVCLIFWLIFGIVGVQFFAGKFYKCEDEDGVKLPVNITANKTECLAKNYTWVNSKVNFDNVMMAYLALFQVATYKGWIEVMTDAIDSTDIDVQPDPEVNVYMYLYFVFFIIFGSFFTLNLFIGVIIENFNQQKKKAGGSLEMFMTEDQKKYYKAMKRMAAKSPQKSIPRPGNIIMGWIFDAVTNQKFDIGIMIIIMLNMLTMALEHYNQSEQFTTILNYINVSFIIIFTVECVLKLIGLRHYYFKFPWNIFDFVVVVLSILGEIVSVALSDVMDQFLVSPTLLRVVRVFRVGRVLRLVKSAKGIRTLLFSLAVSLPALFNIALLLFLVMFIYATFGMSFFMHVKHQYGIDDCFNFETFFRSIIYLFQMCTSAGWNSALAGITNEEDCIEETQTFDNGTTIWKDCGDYKIGVVYLCSYLVLSFLVVVNMYIAVILENFSQATEDVQQGLTSDEFDLFYEKWEKFDPEATKFIPLGQLSDFVDYLEEPLRLPKPNHFMLVKLDIPICENDKVYCRDILDALTKNFLGTSDTPGEIDVNEVEKDKEKIEYKVVSSTLLRQKEHYAARVIQKAWRRYRNERGSLPSPPPYDMVISKESDMITSKGSEMATSKDSKDTATTVNGDTASTKSLKSDTSNKQTAGSSVDVHIEIPESEITEETAMLSPENRTVELRADSDVVA
ncbi:sodium channel protein type 4 subunit alpha B-like isoform X1 [Saccostrea cucullata]|uniref:sodium channel protein type 4 subunit alpha B-like isoform X1 n=1 Tax=Saccostrea cuccullata TaxID=36930 RepID=UPI002ED3E76C